MALHAYPADVKDDAANVKDDGGDGSSWWWPDPDTLEWEAWAIEEKMKEKIEKEEQKVKRKKELAMAEEAAGGGRKVEGPLTKEAVGAQVWNFLNDPDQTDEERLKAIQDMLS